MKRPPYWLTGLGLAVAVLAALACLVFIPLFLHPALSPGELGRIPDPEKRITLQQAQAELQNNTRSTLLQGFAGLFLVAGAAATWRQIQVSRHGQITERITRAVDQLASDSIDVRLGGLYALERVARDSYEDRATVVSILSAYVRTHAPWRAAPAAGHRHPQPAVEAGLPRLGLRAEDVQAALFILAERPRSHDQRPLYISYTDLRVAVLSGRDWRGLICKNANLAGAWIERSRLDGAHLSESDLRQARLAHAVLVDAKLDGAHLQGADLTGADLRGADLTGACLDAADLTNVRADERTRWPDGFDPARLRA